MVVKTLYLVQYSDPIQYPHKTAIQSLVATGLTHAKLVSLTSPCCSGWLAPMNTLKANNGQHSSDGCAFRLKRKNLLSPTPDACCPLLALGSIQLMTGEPRPPVQRAPVTWREWGLCLWQPVPNDVNSDKEQSTKTIIPHSVDHAHTLRHSIKSGTIFLVFKATEVSERCDWDSEQSKLVYLYHWAWHQISFNDWAQNVTNRVSSTGGEYCERTFWCFI